MTRWQYFTATVERGMIEWSNPDEAKHSQSLMGGLDYLGSQGWELVVSLPKETLGTTVSQTLIFKKPIEV